MRDVLECKVPTR